MARKRMDDEQLESLNEESEIAYDSLMESAEKLIRRYLQPYGINAMLVISAYDPLTENAHSGVVYVGDLNALCAVATRFVNQT